MIKTDRNLVTHNETQFKTPEDNTSDNSILYKQLSLYDALKIHMLTKKHKNNI